MAITDQETADALKKALAERMASGAAGIVSVNVDGTTTTYSEKDAIASLEYWERRAAREAKRKRRFGTIDLRNAW